MEDAPTRAVNVIGPAEVNRGTCTTPNLIGFNCLAKMKLFYSICTYLESHGCHPIIVNLSRYSISLPPVTKASIFTMTPCQRSAHSIRCKCQYPQSFGAILISQSTNPSGQPTALLNFTTTSLHLTPNNTVHGGVSSLLIDGACFVAVIPTLSDGQGTATIASSCTYIL